MLIFPDVEKETRTYLLDKLRPRWPDIRITTKVPANTDWTTKPRLVVLAVAGGGQRIGVVYERVLIGFECYAPTQGDAVAIATWLRAYMEAWPQESGVVSGYSDNVRPTDSTDEATGYPSYWLSVNLLFKASDA